MQKEEKEKNILDFKSTMEAFIEEEKPEVSQEEAIRAYKGENIKLNKKNKKISNSEEDEEAEDEEHLKRLKKELLESLERVNVLARKIFEEKGEKDNLKNIKIKSGSNQGKSQEKNREDIINQMREKVQNDKIQNDQERSREE